MRQAELDLGWRISETTGNAEYLLFDHLEKLITMNWKDFDLVFRTSQKSLLG